MSEHEMSVILFSEQRGVIDFMENFFRRNILSCRINLCPIKISTEELFLRYAPNLIFIDFGSYSPEDQEYLISKLERMSDGIPLVGLFDSDQKMHALDYVKRGVRDFLELPLNEPELRKVVQRFKKDGGSHQPRKIGKVFTFFSFKGGVGNTFITLNTAVALARSTKKKVLLWDMALQAGDIPFFLNYKPEYTVSDLVDNLDQIDESYITGVLPPHPSGVSILPSPVKIEDIERLNPAVVEKLVNIFVQHFDYIFVDCGYRLTDQIIPLMDMSLYLFVTTTLELISLRSAVRCLDILEKLNYPEEKVKIVANRYSSKFETIKIDQAKEILKFNLVQFIGNDYVTASQSVNLGQAVIDVQKNSELAKQFHEFAGKIAANFEEKKETKKLFQRLTSLLHKEKAHVA